MTWNSKQAFLKINFSKHMDIPDQPIAPHVRNNKILQNGKN